MALLVGVVTVFVSLLEGINVGLLVPLLESFQSKDVGEGHWVSRAISDLFGKLGIPFELWTILLGLGGIVLCLAALKYLRMILVAKMQIGFAVWIKSRYMWNLSFICSGNC